MKHSQVPHTNFISEKTFTYVKEMSYNDMYQMKISARKHLQTLTKHEIQNFFVMSISHYTEAILLAIYVAMYVCMYVCMYACMHH